MTVAAVNWFDWDQLPLSPPLAEENPRIYIGSDTCEHLLPSLQRALRYCQQQIEFGRKLTIVTALLSNDALKRVLALLESLSRDHHQLEIVCNDWGLIHAARADFRGKLIAGRLLCMQKTDPRFALFSRTDYQLSKEREISHIDGFNVRLKYQPPSPAMQSHLRQCALDTPETLDLLKTMGVDRYEVSNLIQGIDQSLAVGWQVSLHVPEVVVAITRNCQRVSQCGPESPGSACSVYQTRVACDDFPVPLHLQGNVWFYANPDVPTDLEKLGIDRIVHKVKRCLC